MTSVPPVKPPRGIKHSKETVSVLWKLSARIVG